VRRREAKAEAEPVVRVMVVVVMMPLRELQERLLCLRMRQVVAHEHRISVLHRLEQIGIGLRRRQRALHGRGLRSAGEA
jgi:hypothetical protein